MSGRTPVAIASLLMLSALLACSKGGEPAKTDSAVTPPAATGVETPDAGGQVIKVEANTDETGANKFTPNEIEAKKGDVLRFTLVSGVHNVNFVADSNKGATMPAAAPMLQAPGQTFDVKVTWAAGRYYFQCDPHALLGMIGHVTVK